MVLLYFEDCHRGPVERLHTSARMDREVCAAGLAHAIPRPFVTRSNEAHGLGEETEHYGFVTGTAEEKLDEWKQQIIPLINVRMLVKSNGMSSPKSAHWRQRSQLASYEIPRHCRNNS